MQIRSRQPIPCAVLGAILVASSISTALAASNEVEIYTDELTKKGETSFDFLSNAAKAPESGDFRGATIFQALGEYGYGLTDNWDAAIKVPATYAQQTWYGNGLLGEVRFVSSHDDDGDDENDEGGWYWGAEIEAGYVTPYLEKRTWDFEIVPIVGYRIGRWHFIANPGLEAMSAGDDHGLHFEPNFKAAYQFDKRNAVGIEYYVDAGLLKQMLPGDRRDEVAYLTWDTKIGKNDLNVGIGRGMNSASDQWVAKVALEFEL